MQYSRLLLIPLSLFFFAYTKAQSVVANPDGRTITSLNGRWNVIIDPFDVGTGDWRTFWKEKKATSKTDFYEYAFEGGPELEVPGDFNSQLPELTYYESTVWYKKIVKTHLSKEKRSFLHFGGVNYKADVYLNNEKIGEHEGGFTPFEFEITDKLKEGDNSIIVRVNSARRRDGIPGLGFDWFNYGGITRDVSLVETPLSFIGDYFIQLKKGSLNQVSGWVQLSGDRKNQKVTISIPEAKINYRVQTDDSGRAAINFSAKLNLWSPQQPKQYKVVLTTETDSISDMIGFRSIAVSGANILLNGKPVFLKGVNIHEEIPQPGRRAYSESDALQLLGWARDLGCNFVRLSHYPHNEHMVKQAEKMGLMIWDEIPVYQNIDFVNPATGPKMNFMLREMIQRDKNRCAVIIWSMANETNYSAARYTAIKGMTELCRSLDSTRLISAATQNAMFKDSTVVLNDSLSRLIDVLALNEYLGWYRPWPAKPSNMKWASEWNKPLIMTEFGGEALYASNGMPKDAASSWTEEYQEQLYKDQIAMFKNIPFLVGTCPWILVDFRSPVRLQPEYQRGWNRKGLISERGLKKKAWWVMSGFYEKN